MSRHVSNVHHVALRRWRTRPLRIETWREMSAVRPHAGRSALRPGARCARPAEERLDVPLGRCAGGRPIVRQRRVNAWHPCSMTSGSRCRASCMRWSAAVASVRQRSDTRSTARRASILRATAASAVAMQGPYAVLLVNASRASKLWPEAHWIALEAWLAERGLTSLLFWGTAEEELRARRLVASMRRAQLVPRSTILRIAATLARRQARRRSGHRPHASRRCARPTRRSASSVTTTRNWWA